MLTTSNEELTCAFLFCQQAIVHCFMRVGVCSPPAFLSRPFGSAFRLQHCGRFCLQKRCDADVGRLSSLCDSRNVVQSGRRVWLVSNLTFSLLCVSRSAKANDERKATNKANAALDAERKVHQRRPRSVSSPSSLSAVDFSSGVSCNE